MSDRTDGPCSPVHGDASESAQFFSDCPAEGPEAGTSQAIKRRLSDPEGSRYRARQLLGRGGMGRVIEVRDERLGRNVAMKLTKPHTPTGTDLDARLAREAWLMARLDRPGIVPLLDAGVGIDGRIYLTMPVVRGRTLADALSLATDRAARTRLLGHVLEACEAVACARRGPRAKSSAARAPRRSGPGSDSIETSARGWSRS